MLNRRFAVILLSLLLVFPSALAESSDTYLAQLDILSQCDERLDTNTYAYVGHHFWENGCLPASVANALAAAFDSSGISTPDLLRDVMLLMAPEHRPSQYPVEISRLSYIYNGKLTDDYPTLLQLTQSMDAVVHVESRLPGSVLLERLTELGDSRVMLIFTTAIRDNWERIMEILDAFYDAGYPQARLVLCDLATGTPGTTAPFRSAGAVGHYASLYFQAGEFHETGTFYLLDSYPRALEGEPYGGESIFRDYYQFTSVSPSYSRFATFNSLYRATHVTPTVVKLSLLSEPLEALTSVLTDETLSDAERSSAFLELRLRQLDPAMFYGGAVQAFLVLP